MLKRQVRDVQSVAGNVQHLVRRLVDGRATIDRAGGLAARAAACSPIAHVQGRSAEDIAAQHFPIDRDLDRLLVLTKAAVSPANSTVATWAAELIATVTSDVADRLIPQSLFIRLRELGLQYALGGNSFIRVPTWSPAASRGLAHFGRIRTSRRARRISGL